MTAPTKRLEHAIHVASAMPAEQQDLLAAELLERIQDLSEPLYRLSPEERTELEAALAEVARGDFATDEEVADMWRPHGE